MSQITLTADQRRELRKFAQEFKEWLQTPKGRSDTKEHRDHEAYFKNKLSPENIERIDEDEFREIYKTLWASNFFGNKDWYIDNKLLAPNGLDKIKRELKKLLYGSIHPDIFPTLRMLAFAVAESKPVVPKNVELVIL